MIDGRRTTPPANAVKIAITGAIVGGALAMAGTAGADPAPPGPAPAPSAPAPGQPPVESSDSAMGGPPAPPLVGPPPVPEVPNPVYGSGSGPLGSIRDIWHQVRGGNPLDPAGGPSPGSSAPPPGAGPAPPLPPGYVSLNAPESSTPAKSTAPGAGTASGGPALPPGYYALNGPPPPGYEFKQPAGADPSAPAAIAPGPPTP